MNTDELGRALSATEEIVAAIPADAWPAPTVCPQWTVRELLNHLVGGNRLFVAALAHAELPTWQADDHLGDDPLEAYRRSAKDLLAAFGEPDVAARLVSVPFGTVPGAVAAHLRTTEILVHGWDLAHAIGAPTTGLPADVAEQELAFSAEAIRQLPAVGGPFAPPQPVPADAPAIDRLAALLGRTVP